MQAPEQHRWIGAALLGVTKVVIAAGADADVAAVVPAGRRRAGLVIYNDGANTAYLKFGTGPGADDYSFPLPSGGYWELPASLQYDGVVGAFTVGGCTLRVSELYVEVP